VDGASQEALGAGRVGAGASGGCGLGWVRGSAPKRVRRRSCGQRSWWLCSREREMREMAWWGSRARGGRGKGRVAVAV
jgi:hypothetical protein